MACRLLVVYAHAGKFYYKKTLEREYLEDLGIHRRRILKWMIQLMYETDLSGPG